VKCAGDRKEEDNSLNRAAAQPWARPPSHPGITKAKKNLQGNPL